MQDVMTVTEVKLAKISAELVVDTLKPRYPNWVAYQRL